MEGYDTLYEVLVKLFNEIIEIEEKAIITEEFKDISNNDMHIIEAIGLGEPRNMSSLKEKGVKAFYHHKQFHEDMIRATLDGLDEEQTRVLVKALTNLSSFFREYGK